jgi:hypothetical protein
MIPEEATQHLYEEYLMSDIIPFMHDFLRTVPEDKFKELFGSLFGKYKIEIDKKIKTIFPKFTYSTDLEYIGEQIFTLEVKELDVFYKIQFSGMDIVIQRYFSELLNLTQNRDFYENIDFIGIMEYFKFLIIDSIILVSDCEEQHGIRPSRQMGKQNILSSADSYRSSVNMKLFSSAWSSLSSFNASVFLIRQSIELKIKNALGINFIQDSNGAMLRIPGDKFMKFFFDNKEIELPNIKKSIVRKIHNWTQYFVHGGYVLNLWQIDIAHTLLQPLFKGGDRNGTLSIYGGIKISKKYYDNQFKIDLEKYIQDSFFRKRKPKFFQRICQFFTVTNNNKKEFRVVYMSPEVLLY